MRSNFQNSVLLSGLALLGLVVSPVLAQNTTTANAPPPTTQPMASPPDYFAPGYQAKFSFDNAPLTDALKTLSDSFGFQVLPMVPITGNITVISSYPVSTEDALTLAEIALKSNGYFIQRIGHTIKIYAMPDNAAAAPSVTGAVPGLAPAASQPADGQQ